MCDIHDTASEDEVLEKLLDLELVKIRYDSQLNNLTDIEKIII